MGRWASKKKQAQKYTVKKEIYKTLSKMFENGKGQSRHLVKGEGITDLIHSENTYETYKRESKKFADWCRNYTETKDLKKLSELKPYINHYLQHLIDNGYSAWTISTAKSALMKLYQVKAGDYLDVPPRRRRDVVRSRYEAIRDKNISKVKEDYYAKITKAIGLRRSELNRVRGTDLSFNEHGFPFVYVRNGKGGKKRFAIIKGKDDQETQEIVNLFKKQGKLLLVDNVPECFDNHFYRAEYAKRLYNHYARPFNAIPKSDRYYMRGDRKGEVLDRRAMSLVSKNLGHNRLSVIAESYLY